MYSSQRRSDVQTALLDIPFLCLCFLTEKRINGMNADHNGVGRLMFYKLTLTQDLI